MMGRYKDLRELRSKRGHGRKSKKQTDPALPPTIKASTDKPAVPRIKSNLGGRIKQRVRKRAARMAMLKAMQREKIKKREAKKIEARVREGSSDDEASDAELAENVVLPFSDENQLWLTPAKSSVRSKDSSEAKPKKRVSFVKADLLEGGSDGNGSEEEEGIKLCYTRALKSTYPAHSVATVA